MTARTDEVMGTSSIISQAGSTEKVLASSPPQVVIIGAGPAGCLLALLLGKQNLKVKLYDYRPDPRNIELQDSQTRNRSINLAISTRGLTALSLVGLNKAVEAQGVPMHGRCVHSADPSSPLQFHRYGQPGEYLLSVSRAQLNEMLLDACNAAVGIDLDFDTRCTGVNLDVPQVTLEKNGETFQVIADLVVGADGAFSTVRAAMARRPGFNFSQAYVSALYKELSMTNLMPGSKSTAFPTEWLHIWPRHRYMLIALPNDTNSFTSTLFMNKEQMEELNSQEKVEEFFRANFPDAITVMPTLAEDFVKNPAPPLITIRCQPYNYQDKAVLIGDAAHAIVPFYGQGCNAAFEDCRLLAESFEKHGWENRLEALKSYAQARKQNADAIAALALDHYEDMSSRSATPFFVFKRRLEILANRFFPRSFLPLYSMITFSNIPYADAVARAAIQDRRIEQFLIMLGVISATATVGMMGRRTWQKLG